MDIEKEKEKEEPVIPMPKKTALTCSELGQFRYPRNPNYYYVNRHPKIKPTMSLVEENYLHPKANSSTVGSSVSLPPKEGSLQRRANGNNFQRFDSGVGDLEPNGGEYPLQTPRSCSPKTFQYDYAEYPTHQYEELPNKSRTFTREEFHQNHMSNLSGDIPYEDDAPPNAHEMEMTRKRFNPLYEAVTKAIPDKNSHPQTSDAAHKHLKCLQMWFIIFVVFVLVCLLTILFITLFYNPSDAALVTKFRNLETKYESLELKYRRLVSFLATSESNDSTVVLSSLSRRMNLLENETTDFNSALNLSIYSLQSSLGARLQNISKFAVNVSNELQRTQLEFEEKMSNISKMPGPRGPPGVGDLSQCTLQNITDYSSDERTSTVWIPSRAELKNYVIMAGSCSTRGGQSTQLESRDGQYRCLCYGYERKKYPLKLIFVFVFQVKLLRAITQYFT